jgi:hypothetical protein
MKLKICVACQLSSSILLDAPKILFVIASSHGQAAISHLVTFNLKSGLFMFLGS